MLKATVYIYSFREQARSRKKPHKDERQLHQADHCQHRGRDHVLLPQLVTVMSFGWSAFLGPKPLTKRNSTNASPNNTRPWMLAYQQSALCEKGLAGRNALVPDDEFAKSSRVCWPVWLGMAPAAMMRRNEAVYILGFCFAAIKRKASVAGSDTSSKARNT